MTRLDRAPVGERPRHGRPGARLGLGLAVILAIGAHAGAAHAVVAGTQPIEWRRFNKINGSAESTGNTLMIDSHGRCSNVNDTLLSQSEALIRGVPSGAELLGAYLFWSGSRPAMGADRSVDLTVADGTVFRNVAASDCFEVDRLGGYFYCRAEVTDLVRAHPGSQSYNGMYLVGNVQAQPGFCDPDGTCTTDPFCQARYAGWSLIVVWRDPNGTTARDVILFDGFMNLDETAGSAGVSRFTINNFEVGNPAVAELAYFGLEGDASLGVPPQDQNPDPQIQCTTCFDYFSVNGTKLQDGFGWPNNLFNSSTANSIDLDKFNISNLVRPGDRSLTIEVGSGDGVVSGTPPPGGGGESFFLGWVLLTVDTLAPNFSKSRTFKSADPTTASPGDVIQYQILVTNEGSLAATNVIVQDAIPANTTYVLGSTRIDNGAPLADQNGTSPLVAGLNLGTIPPTGDNDRQVTFRVRVNGPLPAGVTEVTNLATVRSTELPMPRELRATTQITQSMAQLGTPTKSVVPLGGAQVKPGDTLLYTLTIPNAGQRPASGVLYDDDLPNWVRNFRIVSINAGPEATFTFSPPPAGTNARGRLTVNNITVPAQGVATVTYSVTVDSVAEFAGAGVALPDIDGKEIVNQGRVSGPMLMTPLLTDDPNTAPSPDPTRVVLQYAPRVTVTKGVTDANGNPAEPGDTLTYEIRVANAGNLRASISMTDDLPGGVGTFVLGACPSGATCAFSGSRLTVMNLVVAENGGAATITFTVRINDPIANATQVQNCAAFQVQEAPRQNGQACSPTLTVVSTPVLSASAKTVSDPNGGDVEPGDTLIYSIIVRNTGNQAATNVVVTDPIDASLENAVAGEGGTVSNGTATWTPATTPALSRIDRGAQVVLTLTTRVRAGVASGTVVSNQARLASTEVPGPTLTDDPTTPAASDPTNVTVRTQPRFTTSTKAVLDQNGGAVEPGDRLTYTITVTNSGRGSASDVVVVDPIDVAALTNVTPAQGGNFASGQITWDRTTAAALASIAAGASVTLSFDANVVSPLENGRVISNQARVTSREVTSPQGTDDPSTAAAGDPTNVTVRSAANLSTSTKAVLDQNGGAAQPGDALSYTIVVRNTGNAPARNVVVTDVVDPNLTSVAPAQGGRFDAGSRTITWDAMSTPALARVVAGADATLTFAAVIAAGLPDGTIVSNQARLASADLTSPALTDDPSTPAAGDPTRLTVVSRPDFVTSTKTFVDVNGGAANPGDTIQWTIAVIQSGASAANNVVVTDVVDANLTDIVPAQGGRFDAGSRTITWDATSLAALSRMLPGARVELGFSSRIVLPLDNATVIRNQALIRSTEVTTAQPSDDPSTPVRGDPTQLTVVSAPDLAGSPKTIEDPNGAPVKPGDTLRFVITVTNRGTAAAQDVVVTDVVDAGLENVVPESGGRFDAGSRTVTWDRAGTAALARVVPSAPVTVAFTARVRVGLDNGTVIANQARLAAAGVAQPGLTDDPRTAEVNDPTRVTVVSGADFTSTTLTVADANGGSVEPGDFLDYTLTIANTGDGPGQNVVATMIVDASILDVVPGQGGRFDAATRTLTWDAAGTPALARVDVGARPVVTVRARLRIPLDNGVVVSEQARVTAQGLASPVPSDDPATPALDDPTRVTVVARTGFAVTKSVVDENGGDATPGDLLLYTITVTNTGTAPLRNVVIQDPIQPNLRLAELLDGARDQNGVITWDAAGTPALALVAPGTPAVVRLRLAIVVPTANGAVVQNQAVVTPEGVAPQPSDDPSTPTANDPTRLTVRSSPNLSRSTKAVTDRNGGQVEPGDDLDFVLTVRNDGTDTARDLVVTDVIDTNLTNVTAQDGGTFDAGSRTVTWNGTTTPALVALRPNEQVVLRVSARVASPLDNGTVIRNQGRITSPSITAPVLTDNPATPAPNDPTTVTVVALPNFAETTKAALDENGGHLRPGDRITYTITVRNSGRAVARDVVVRDAIPASLGSIEAGQGGRVAGNVVTWDGTTTPALVSLAPGASATLTVRAAVLATTPNGTVVSNQAEVTSREVTAPVRSDDPATAARGDPTNLTVGFADLTRTTKDYLDENGGDVNPGDRLVYTIVVRNTGAVPARNVVVTDALDPNLVEVAADSGGQIQNNTVTWSPGATPALASIAAGASVTLTLRARVRELLRNGVVVRNQAQVGHADESTLTPSDNPRTANVLGDSTDITIVAVPNLRPFAKSVVDENGGEVQPGDFLTYTLLVRNTGTTFATNVTVTDVVDGALLDVVPGQGGRQSGRTITWDRTTTPALGQVNPATEVALTFRARVAAGTAHGTRIRNQGELRAEEIAQPIVSDDPATRDVPDDATIVVVSSNPGFTESTKSVRDDNGGNVEPGDVLTYTIAVRNGGARDGEGVTLVDPTPTGTVYVAGSTRLNGAAVPDGAGGLSPVAAGLRVSSAGAPAGTVRVGQTATVTYQLRVLATTLPGAIVQNQAAITSTLTTAVLTDDPATPEVDDPTSVVVGTGANLRSTQMIARLVVDGGAVGVAEVNDVLEYVVTIPNLGNAAATGVVLAVPVPARTSFVPGSITFNGQVMSDAVDGDPGELMPGAGPSPSQVRVRVATIAARARATITFRVRIDAGPLITAQGQVESAAARPELTDADGNDLNGDQPTVVAVGTAPVAALEVTKDARDLNGGAVQPGDTIEYVLNVRNTGNTTFTDIELQDDLPAGTTFVAQSASSWPGAAVTIEPAPAGANQRGRMRVTNLALAAGRDLRFVFRVTVGANAVCGTRVENVARFSATGVPSATTAPKTFLVCGGLGSAAVRGVVFQDKGARDKIFNGEDYRLSGFQVLAFHVERPQSPVRTAVSAADGTYSLFDLPPGVYHLRSYSSTGALFATLENLRVDEGSMREQNLLIDPRGIVYDAVSGNPVEGVTAWLHFDDTNATDAGKLVPPEFLGERQQGQKTNALGMYQFDARAGHRYKLVLQPAGQAFVFPSTLIPPRPGFAEVTPPDNTVVPNARPDRSASTKYFLRFNLQRESDAVFNNHVPLDPVTSLVRVEKRANKRYTSVGGLVSYTVQVQNLSSRDFVEDAPKGTTPVFVEDLLPRGFKYRKGSVRAKRVDLSGGRQTEVLLPQGDRDPQGFATEPSGAQGRALRFGPYDVRAGETIVVRYQTVVGVSVPQGEYRNRALVIAPGSVPLSNEAFALVQVVRDGIFDQGVVLGKVFCDHNGNGVQDKPAPDTPPEAREDGVEGARIYIDTGWYAETGADGKFHLKDVDPGTRLLKVDRDTLPAGSTFTTDERRIVYVTRGLAAKIDFGVRCAGEQAGVQALRVRRLAAKKPPPTRIRMVRGNVRALEAMVGDERLPVLECDAFAWQGAPPRAMARDPINARIDGGRLAERLHFDLAVTKGAAIENWILRIRDVRGEIVHELGGRGPPPRRVAWDGTDAGVLLLKANELYRYELIVVGPSGAQGTSAPRPFGVMYGKTTPPVAPKLDIEEVVRVKGRKATPFVKDGLEPTTETAAVLKRVILRMKAAPSTTLEIEVHTDDRGKRLSGLLRTLRQATALKEIVTGAGISPKRVVARGFGARKPLAPNVGDAARAKNRRVVLRLSHPGEPGALVLAPIPAISPAKERVFVGEVEVPIAKDGSFERAVVLPPDGVIPIEMRRGDGRAIVYYREGKPKDVRLDAPLEGDLGKMRVSLAGRAIVLPGLSWSLATRSDSPAGAADATRVFELRGERFPVVRWSLEVEKLGGDVLLVRRGEGVVPGELSWDGRVDGKAALSPGKWRAYVAAHDPRGVRYTSAPASFEIAAPKEAPKKKPPEARAAPSPAPSPKPKKPDFERTLTGKRFFREGRTEKMLPAMRRALNAAAKTMASLLKKDPRARFEIVVHTDETSYEADIAVCEAQGEAVRAYLVSRKIPALALSLRTIGGKEPLVPNQDKKSRARNRRVALRSLAPMPSVVPLPPVKKLALAPIAKPAPVVATDWPPVRAHVRVLGADVPVAFGGGFKTLLKLRRGEPVAIDIASRTGARAFIVVPFTEGAPEPKAKPPDAARPALVPATKPAALVPATKPAALVPATKPAALVPATKPAALVPATKPAALVPATKPAAPPPTASPAKVDGPAAPAATRLPAAKPLSGERKEEPAKAPDLPKPPEKKPPEKKEEESPPKEEKKEQAPVPAGPTLPPPAKRINESPFSPPAWMAGVGSWSDFRVSMGRSGAAPSGGEVPMRARGGGTGISAPPPGATAVLVAQALPPPPRKDAASAGANMSKTLTNAPPAEKPGDLGDAEVEAVLSGVDLRKLPPVRAAILRASLPPKGTLLKTRVLRVSGTTHPENKLTVNGKPVAVDPKGGWRVALELPVGKSKVAIRTRDKAGHEGALDWPVEVSSWSLFVLALGEGAMGQAGVKLDGAIPTMRTEVGGKMFLQGRTAIYVKGQVQGKWIFENLRVTAHFDSAKRKEFEPLFQQVIDPERWYPVYGDTAKEVRDVNARDKLYVLVEFDASKFLIGNFKSQIEGVELLSYDRAFYGLQLDFKKAFKKGFDTAVKVFASRDGEIQQHAHVELRGTGGSIYYLKHEEILEGSEKVRVVVRDRDSGLELYSTPRARYSDYTIDYRQGRILLKSTLPSTADASFLVNNNLATVLNGHSVYMVIDYEYAGSAIQSGNAFGVHVRQKLGGIVEIGGGHVREGRPGSQNPDYNITGAHLKIEKDGHYFRGEFARSRAVDSMSFVSDDGGLSYKNLGNRFDSARAREGAGNAFKFEAGGDIAKAAGWKGQKLEVRAFVQQLDSGFFASGKLQDQGQTRYGLSIAYKPTPKDELLVRHDGLTAELHDMGDLSRAARRSSRAVTTAQYTRKEGKWTFIGEYNHTFITDDALGGGSLSDSIAAGLTYDLHKRVQLLGRLEAWPRAGDRTSVANGQVAVAPLQPAAGDHFGATIGARFNLTDKTILQVTETVRGSGENATALGLKTALSDTASLYVEERLLQRDSRTMGTTVVGGEQKMTKNSRAYGEYQLENGVEGARNRAVMGAGHRFELKKGVHFDVAYERSQTFGDALGGRSSRDAVSTAYELLREKWLKAAGRYEVRYDNGDERVAGQDKLQFLTTNLFDLTATPDLSFLVKLNYSNTDNRTLAQTEAELLEMSAGFAVRPRTWNWFNLLAKYTKFVEQRPVNLLDGFGERVSSDIFTIIPIFDLPKGFQIVEKFAFKREREFFVDLPPGFSDTFLWINRLNYHLTGWLDISGEYRYLTNLAAAQSEHGFLFEASLILKKYVRLGVGYNFTRFTDDELVRNRVDNRGVFFRVIGMY